jgi:hypothetical protein
MDAKFAPECYVRAMNQQDRSFIGAPEAEIRYAHGDFRVVRGGTFVRCSVTGQPILIEDLKYWSVERQEAYASTAAVLQRLAQLRSPSVYGRPPR